MSNEIHWENVRLQETRKETDKEKEGGDYGYHRKTNLAKKLIQDLW